jgi:hypothetical protein
MNETPISSPPLRLAWSAMSTPLRSKRCAFAYSGRPTIGNSRNVIRSAPEHIRKKSHKRSRSFYGQLESQYISAI